jgi:hypothetical protein
MAGGLIQIASYGLHDIYLIGNPQITFFKIVYRRHTNFAMEYIEENFTGTQNFGSFLSCNLSKAGDLLHKLYIKINIPQIAINKATYGNLENNTTNLYSQYLNYYNSIIQFINQVNYNMIQPLYLLLKVNGLKYIDIKNKYTITYNRMNYVGLLNNINNISWIFLKTFALPLKNGTSHIIYINQQTNIVNFLDFNNYYNRYITSTSIIPTDLSTLLDNYLLQVKIIKKELYSELLFYKKINNTMNRQNINFAWVEYLGHQIINRAELEIGGKVIDFTDAVRMNIQYQLSNKIELDLAYNKMIGNVPELTTYDNNIKQPYVLYIPLDFWFSKYSGLSMPLIYLRFHDVKINIQLNDLVNCCYYEKLNSNIYIEDIINLGSISLVVNYIYLDSDERTKFAQLNHEYLIDQSQIANYTNITTQVINIELPFFNLIKQLFWIIRDQDNISRLKYFDYSASFYSDIYSFDVATSNNNININDGTARNQIKIRITNINVSSYINIGDTIEIYNSIYYSGSYTVQNILNEYIFINYDYFMKESYEYNYNITNNNGTTSYNKSDSYQGNSQAYIKKVYNINPFEFSTLQINGVERFDKSDGIYNNFVQPYQNNIRSPDYGLNCFSFAINPEEYQPSGFCNFNALDLKTMTFQLNSLYLNKNINKTVNMIIYGYGYNILKFSYGKAGLILNI